MCVVLDTCTFGAFFDSDNKEHSKFSPVLAWVVNGRGKLVFGGMQYKREMNCARRYLRIFASLERAGKLTRIPDDEVDRQEKEVKKLEPNPNFDDAHLVAIIRVSACRIVCTNDRRAIPYLKDSRFYGKGMKKPKIYQSQRNASILTDSYIADVCKPVLKLSKSQIGTIFD